VKRNRDDVALRMFLRLYRRGNPYSYEVKTAQDYIDWYYQMTDVMAEKLPDTVRIVHYEEMVSDPKTVLRTVAGLCGVPMGDKPIPALGDDRDCSAPYRAFMAAALGH